MNEMTVGNEDTRRAEALRQIKEKNNHRARWAVAALETFARSTGLDLEEDGKETAIMDLLADLMHLSDIEGMNFDVLIERARGHYINEVVGQAERLAEI